MLSSEMSRLSLSPETAAAVVIDVLRWSLRHLDEKENRKSRAHYEKHPD